IRYHRMAAAINPTDGYARYGVAAALMADGEYEAAIDEHRAAAELEPGAAYILNGIGDCQERLRRYDAARAAYCEALKINPRDAYSQAALARLLISEGKPQDALPLAREAANLTKRHDFPWSTVGDVHRVLGSYPDAVRAYREALVRNQS